MGNWRDRFCLLYTSDAADEEDSVDLGGRRNVKKKKKENGVEGRIDRKTDTLRKDKKALSRRD